MQMLVKKAAFKFNLISVLIVIINLIIFYNYKMYYSLRICKFIDSLVTLPFAFTFRYPLNKYCVRGCVVGVSKVRKILERDNMKL